jgi:hypothetical protein
VAVVVVVVGDHSSLVVKVGPDDNNLHLPIQDTGRLIINVSDPTPTLSSTTNTMGVWMHEKLRSNRKLGVADFVNPAGNRVSPNAESLQSAINDFSADATLGNLINGSSMRVNFLSDMGCTPTHQ